jgi:hypothetical protein
LLRKEEIGKKEIENFKKIKWLSIIDDFVTFLYNIERYDTDFSTSIDLKGCDPGITLYTWDIQDIRYTFYFFEYLSWFYRRYN